MTCEEAITKRSHIRCLVDNWLEQKGYGFASAQGQKVFILESVIRGPKTISAGSSVIVKIQRSGKGYKAADAWFQEDFDLE